MDNQIYWNIRFSISINYLTFADAIVYIAYIFVGVTILQNVLVHRYQQRDGSDGADKIDKLSQRWIPLAFIFSLIIAGILFLNG